LFVPTDSNFKRCFHETKNTAEDRTVDSKGYRPSLRTQIHSLLFIVTWEIVREPNWMISSGGYGGGRDYRAVIN
jgi:hypothetical protein